MSAKISLLETSLTQLHQYKKNTDVNVYDDKNIECIHQAASKSKIMNGC